MQLTFFQFYQNNQNTFAYIKLTMFNESIKKEMTSKHYQYIQSFPKEWRKDPTVFNLVSEKFIILSFFLIASKISDDFFADFWCFQRDTLTVKV